VAGHVTKRTAAVGTYLQPGQEVMAVVPLEIWVTANFKETQLRLMRPGQKVTFKVDAYKDLAFTGHVDSVQRGAGQAFALLPAQNATGNYVKVVQRVPVKIVIDGPNGVRFPLGPGMSVKPRVQVRP
jgi:membrane fusion protein (multidrug efflux system)